MAVSASSEAIQQSIDGGYHRRDAFDLDLSDVATTGSATEQFDVTHDGRFGDA